MTQDLHLDLVTLVAGKDERETVDGLLSSRSESLGIRSIRYEILVHPRRDPGCFHEAPAVLQPYLGRAKHALVILDFEGSGQESLAPERIAADLKGRLVINGWDDFAHVIVINPELESWVWSESLQVEVTLGWVEREMRLRDWLSMKGFWPIEHSKPHRPKECLQMTLKETKVQRSASLYRQLSQRVSLERCQDGSFLELKEILRAWFPKSVQI